MLLLIVKRLDDIYPVLNNGRFSKNQFSRFQIVITVEKADHFLMTTLVPIGV
jgi:hypothetical protein